MIRLIDFCLDFYLCLADTCFAMIMILRMTGGGITKSDISWSFVFAVGIFSRGAVAKVGDKGIVR